jgi:hypothetical protein
MQFGSVQKPIPTKTSCLPTDLMSVGRFFAIYRPLVVVASRRRRGDGQYAAGGQQAANLHSPSQPHGKIIQSRGIKHGDPLSLYFFISCTEGLSSLLLKVEHERRITGLPITRGYTVKPLVLC